MTTPTPPQTTDTFAQFIANLVNQLTTGVGAPAIESAAEAQVPLLAAPIIKQIFEAAIGYLAGKLSILEQDGILTVVFNVQADAKEYAMLQSLAALQQAQSTGDPDAISKATQDAVNQWGSTLHFGGTATVST